MNHFAAIQAALGPADLDAVFLTCRANRFYAAGFDSYDTDGACLITPNHAFYWTDGRYIEAAQKAIDGAEVGLSDRPHPYEVLAADVIRRFGIRRLGFDEAAMTVADHRRYTKALPCELVPASALMTSLRAVKDEGELAVMRQAQAIAEKAYLELLNDIRPGVTEKFLAARLTFLMLSGGAENISFDPIVISGANTSLPHGVPTEKAVENGDFVTMDFGALYHGYCSDTTRTVAVGHVSDEMAKVYDTVLAAQTAGIAAARAGILGRDLDGAARAVIEKAGYGAYFTHSFGHSLGVEIHEAPNASPASEKPLPAGAVISAEPGIYLPGRFGVRIEDVLVLRGGGCEDLTSLEKKLLIL